jgi:2-keto-4-pentenoate hydratase
LSKTWPDITMEDAYAISTEVAKRKMAAGARLIGHGGRASSDRIRMGHFNDHGGSIGQ